MGSHVGFGERLQNIAGFGEGEFIFGESEEDVFFEYEEGLLGDEIIVSVGVDDIDEHNGSVEFDVRSDDFLELFKEVCREAFGTDSEYDGGVLFLQFVQIQQSDVFEARPEEGICDVVGVEAHNDVGEVELSDELAEISHHFFLFLKVYILQVFLDLIRRQRQLELLQEGEQLLFEKCEQLLQQIVVTVLHLRARVKQHAEVSRLRHFELLSALVNHFDELVRDFCNACVALDQELVDSAALDQSAETHQNALHRHVLNVALQRICEQVQQFTRYFPVHCEPVDDVRHDFCIKFCFLLLR